jgi:hypothetical protein
MLADAARSDQRYILRIELRGICSLLFKSFTIFSLGIVQKNFFWMGEEVLPSCWSIRMHTCQKSLCIRARSQQPIRLCGSVSIIVQL